MLIYGTPYTRNIRAIDIPIKCRAYNFPIFSFSHFHPIKSIKSVKHIKTFTHIHIKCIVHDAKVVRDHLVAGESSNCR